MDKEQKAQIIILSGVLLAVLAGVLVGLFLGPFYLLIFLVFLLCAGFFGVFILYFRLQHNIDKIKNIGGLNVRLEERLFQYNAGVEFKLLNLRDMIAKGFANFQESKQDTVLQETLQNIALSIDKKNDNSQIIDLQNKIAALLMQMIELQKDQTTYLKQNARSIDAELRN